MTIKNLHLRTYLDKISGHGCPATLNTRSIFSAFMVSRRKGHLSWYDKFPTEEMLFRGLNKGENAVLVVDVGGNQGHDLLGMRRKYPSQRGTLILQDLPEVIEKLNLVEDGIICMQHDFFTPQPVKGM